VSNYSTSDLLESQNSSTDSDSDSNSNSDSEFDDRPAQKMRKTDNAQHRRKGESLLIGIINKQT
jgi:hypothetical protein